jgi:hypothetical protein
MGHWSSQTNSGSFIGPDGLAHSFSFAPQPNAQSGDTSGEQQSDNQRSDKQGQTFRYSAPQNNRPTPDQPGNSGSGQAQQWWARPEEGSSGSSGSSSSQQQTNSRLQSLPGWPNFSRSGSDDQHSADSSSDSGHSNDEHSGGSPNNSRMDNWRRSFTSPKADSGASGSEQKSESSNSGGDKGSGG